MIWILGASIVGFLGFAAHRLGWYFLISGYNTMSDEEKERVDIKATARLIGWMCYGISGIFLVIALIEQLTLSIPLEPIFIGLLLFLIGMLWRTVKYDGNIFDENGLLRPKGKKRFISMIIVSVLLVTIVPGMMIWFNQPTDIVTTDTSLVIKGSYGQDITYDSIEEVTLTSLPEISVRTNGASVGSRQTGHFRTKDGEDVMLYVDQSIQSVIRIETNGKPIYLNQDSQEATERLYEEVRNK